MKRIIIIIIINIIYSNYSCASGWDEIKQCLKEPCNCGYGKRYEVWNGVKIDKGDENPLCPPSDKARGRADNTCIAGLSYPGNFSLSYLGFCAESTNESTYFSPKIRIRHQTCNETTCWGQNTTLNSDGQCVVWPGPYALPMLRVCARIALPEKETPNIDPDKPPIITPADPGYTVGKHLNYEGYVEDDKIIYGVDGKPIIFRLPKLCAYKDPSLYDILTGDIDFLDYNTTSQPIHNTGGIHPIAKVILFLLDAEVDLHDAITSLLASIFGGSDIVSTVIKDIIKAVSFIWDLYPKLLEQVVREFGQFNRVVDYSLGCVELPMANYPPPYCDKITKSFAQVVVQPICSVNDNNEPSFANATNKCVVSGVGLNNIINNMIRVGFDNILPICGAGVDPSKTADCVTFSGGPLTASLLHTASARKDLIHSCSKTTSGICVNTSLPEPAQGFRIVYGVKTGNVVTPSNFYIEDNQSGKDPVQFMPDCAGKGSEVCQLVYGINTGQFADVTLSFPKIEVQNAVSNIVADASVQDPDGNIRNINLSIVRVATYDEVIDQQITPNQICAHEGNTLIGCTERNLSVKPKLYDCASPPDPALQCISDYYSPKFIAGISIGNDSSFVVVEPSNVSSQTGGDINLVGYTFSSFVTDDTFISKPFSGDKAFNASSIYGNYKDNKTPYDSKTGEENPDAIYLNGLEYINDKYIQGGTKVCLQQKESDKCPNNKTLCVLSYMLNNDTVDCSLFTDIKKKYNNLHVCTDQDSGCSKTESLPTLSGRGSVDIYTCSIGYCYKDSNNNELCTASFKPENRKIPDPSIGYVLPDSQYYDITKTDLFDAKQNFIRDKTAFEMNLCVDVPQRKCQAVASETVDDGYASWPETLVGEQATGTCLDGYVPQDPQIPLERYCISSIKDKAVKFEQLAKNKGCIKKPSSGF